MDPISDDMPENPAAADAGAHAPAVVSPAAAPPPQALNRALKTRAADALSRHNPFYLLSAMSMLGACLLLANSLSWSPIPFSRLLSLLGILNLYELLLLGLGLFLVKRGHNQRDSTQLLVLAAVFLADAAFLNSEVVTFSLAAGLAINSALLLLAIGKFLLTARFLGIPLYPGRLISVTLLYAVLFGLPAWLKTLDRAAITGVHLYACWWAAALVAATYDLLTGRAVGGVDTKRWGLLTTLFIAIPMFSLLTHIGILHYVYNEPFTAPHAAPILLLLAIVINRIPGPIAARIGIPSAAHARAIQCLLPVAAVIVSASARFTLHVPLLGELSPFMLTLGAAVLTYALTIFRPHAWVVIIASAVAAGAYALSPSAATVMTTTRKLWVGLESAARFAFDAALYLIPSTRVGWGILAIVTAFALLAIGARISLRRPALAPDTPLTPDP